MDGSKLKWEEIKDYDPSINRIYRNRMPFFTLHYSDGILFLNRQSFLSSFLLKDEENNPMDKGKEYPFISH